MGDCLGLLGEGEDLLPGGGGVEGVEDGADDRPGGRGGGTEAPLGRELGVGGDVETGVRVAGEGRRDRSRSGDAGEPGGCLRQRA